MLPKTFYNLPVIISSNLKRFFFSISIFNPPIHQWQSLFMSYYCEYSSLFNRDIQTNSTYVKQNFVWSNMLVVIQWSKFVITRFTVICYHKFPHCRTLSIISDVDIQKCKFSTIRSESAFPGKIYYLKSKHTLPKIFVIFLKM